MVLSQNGLSARLFSHLSKFVSKLPLLRAMLLTVLWGKYAPILYQVCACYSYLNLLRNARSASSIITHSEQTQFLLPIEFSISLDSIEYIATSVGAGILKSRGSNLCSGHRCFSPPRTPRSARKPTKSLLEWVQRGRSILKSKKAGA